MTIDRLLTIIAIIWCVVVILYLAVIGVIHVEASTDPGGEEIVMTCGTWTYYNPGIMQRVRSTRGMLPCVNCAGMAATVDQAHLGQRIQIWFHGSWRGVFHVVDVGNGANRPGLVGEVDHHTAVDEWDRAGPWWGCYRLVPT